MADGNANQRATHSHFRTFLWLGLFIVLAFALRSAFNIGPGTAASGHNLFTGNDPYYHLRTATHVIETGQNLDVDHAVNYPEGRANPNPPFWTWTSAAVASALQGLHLGGADPVGLALNIMVAFWGALTCIPVYMMAKDMWGRKAGLWAAFFLAISAPHIMKSFWGYADHDAISVFFILLGLALLMRGLRGVDRQTFVKSWGQGLGQGLGATVRANRNPLVYGALAGVSFTAVAVTWKGYPYIFAIVALGAVLQLVVDHFRRRDSTATWMVYFTATLLGVLLPYLLYYQHFPNFFGNTVQPTLYVLAAMLVLGLLLLPMRDLPSIVVFPAIAAALLIGILYVKFLQPGVYNTVTSGLGYFEQSKLYSTIGEAQRPSLGEVAADLGFFSFLIAFWGFGHTVKRAYKGHQPEMLLFAFAAISIFLMFAASRFIANAAPVFAVFMGYVMVRIGAWLRGSEVRRRFRATQGQNIASRSATAIGWRTGILGALVGILILLPNAWIGADAAMSYQFKQDHGLISNSGVNHFGAYGQSFELASNGWLSAEEYLATLDNATANLEDKPAVIAWWDYGHWNHGIGLHPTVADPFQSHYEISGHFLAADTESEAQTWLAIDLLLGDWRLHDGHFSPAVTSYLTSTNHTALLNTPMNAGYDAIYNAVSHNVTGNRIFAFYDGLETATGRSIHYLGVDDRMGSFIDASSPSQERGIFYAPVFLSDKNPDDYITTNFQANNQVFTVRQYDVDANGHSFSRGDSLEKWLFVDQSGGAWTYYRGYLYHPGQTPVQGYDQKTGILVPSTTQWYYSPQAKYTNSMFAKAFGGQSATRGVAGQGLEHWRVVYQSLVPHAFQDGSALRRVALLEYYHGVQVSGTVHDDTGAPMTGVSVSFQDASGATHGRGATNAQGQFSVAAPFSSNGDLKLVVLGADGSVVYADNGTAYQYTRADAASGRAVAGISVSVPRGSASGTVYLEKDAATSADRNHYNANNDTALVGASVRLAALNRTTTTDASGKYTFGDLQAGTYTVSVTKDGYQPTTATARVPAGATGTSDVAMTVLPSPVTVRFLDYAANNGTALPGIQVRINGTATAQPVTTNATGIGTTTLTEGTYTFTVDQNVTVGTTTVHYTGRATQHVAFGGAPVAVDIRRE